MTMRFDVSLFSIPALTIAVLGLVMGIVLVVGGAGAITRIDAVRVDQHAWSPGKALVRVATPTV
ncbi:hypothetical protein [Chelatococcus asaccharovorans]|uniref:Uncharacterized protein n=1 Tax=Chelatococcus asaccharovorans TaxID=28210 RepID=A0A2V3UC69_9HYPH|nr:hypothetical protein [Chelatococcus asaccharovorans]MBS7703222.1 hypothetical protein [Chelatococcus asaccharovorans]PXW61552.1 hypothetical protein C7450_10368 [Chelatococcus asaccharovorans]CAH1672598.1 conserved hypothetical protein [Chelatococcus asaccharovorans]CAH1675992.1 conserved hypothetical protein [Chelatococcus asaccharovorans]